MIKKVFIQLVMLMSFYCEAIADDFLNELVNCFIYEDDSLRLSCIDRQMQNPEVENYSDNEFIKKFMRGFQNENEKARLSTYDFTFLSGRVGVTSGFPNWNVSTEISKMTDEKTIILVAKAIEPVYVPYAKQVSLYLRNKEGVVDAYINWGDYLGSDEKKSVRYRIDDETAVTQMWDISSNYKAVFNPNPAFFIGSLLGKKKLLIELTPYGQNPTIVEFNIQGLEDNFEEFRENATVNFYNN